MRHDAVSRTRPSPLPVFAVAVATGIALVLIYVLTGMSPETWDYNLPRRIKVVAAIALVGAAVGAAAVVFQTITANHILTPSIMGLDSLYLFLQTLVIYAFGSGQLVLVGDLPSFLLTLLLMAGSSGFLFLFMFRGETRNVYFLVLVGLIFGTAFVVLFFVVREHTHEASHVAADNTILKIIFMSRKNNHPL